jgi:NTE family protein
MAKRALVLGGGGLVGIAWETGVLLGLRDGGVDAREADLVIGTSAGSMVGVRVAAGHDLADQLQPPEGGLPMPELGLDLDAYDRIMDAWTSVDLMTEEVAREIGREAHAAPTCDVAAWVAQTGGACGVDDWPATDYVAVSVDVATGRHRGVDRDSGVLLASAIAASCAIPGIFPPVPFDGALWMDGGVRSGTSADIAAERGADRVLVVAPMCARMGVVGPLSERALTAELAGLEAAGIRAHAILPGEAEASRMGRDLMDANFIGPALEVGHAQGLTLAKGDAADWLD